MRIDRIEEQRPWSDAYAGHFIGNSADSRLMSHSLRCGISLIEILISMFVLLFGLLGVASIFPVGSHYMNEGEKFDYSSALAQNAFEEMGVRGMLRPEVWLYPDGSPVMDANGDFVVDFGNGSPGPGMAFVIDPLGQAAGFNAGVSSLDVFPHFNMKDYNDSNPWNKEIPGVFANTGDRFPVRRVTLPQALGIPLTNSVAETIFRLRDDLSVDFPENSDQPSVQLWQVDSGGQLLTRQYNGRYSWLATVVPTTDEALIGLQPARGESSYSYDVSVVIFHRRVMTPSLDTERLIEAELLDGGELVLFVDRNENSSVVDAAVEDVRPGNWICLMGVNKRTGDFLMKWYRILSLDDETATEQYIHTIDGVGALRRAMLIGPDWPSPSDSTTNPTAAIIDLRAAILPGTVSVVTRTMQLQNN